MLALESIVQSNSGSFVGTSGNATLSATTAGNVVLLVVAQTAGLVAPAGFTIARHNTLLGVPAGIYWKATAGGETSFAIAPSSSQVVTWAVYEVEGLDSSDPMDITTSFLPAFVAGTGATLATGTTAVSGTYDGLIMVLHACEDLTSPTPGTWSGHTGGLAEHIEVGGNDGTISLGLSVSLAFSLSLAAWASTATKTAPVGQSSTAGVVIFTAAGAKRAPTIEALTGFEFGTVLGLATGSAGRRIFDSFTGTPAIVATTPRSGDWCLELSASAAAENVLWGEGASEVLGTVTTQMPCRGSIYIDALPAADTVLFSATPATAGDAVVCRYVQASQKIGMKLGAGSEVLSDATVSADVWINIDWRIDGRTTTHLLDWQIDYTDSGTSTVQTQATATATAVVSGWALRLGWTASSTATIRYDDWVVGRVGGQYPLGNIKVLAISPDPAGTVVLSGTAGNFNTFTANGTLAAWNATTARNNIDERPPTIGASADGFVQIATATGEYVEIPMTTINAAVDHLAAIRGVMMRACGWATTTVASRIGFKAFDGTVEMDLVPQTDMEFDNSTTAPAWVCGMVRVGTTRHDWTQTKLDALVFRVGYSGDADPDVGIHGIYAEVALRVGDVYLMSSHEEGMFTLEVRDDPDSHGIISFITTSNHGSRGCTFTYSILGVEQTPIYVGPQSFDEEIIGATDISTITEMTLVPDPVA